MQRRIRAANSPRDAGYNLVALVVAFTVLSVALAAVLPTVSQTMQRAREAELIFRGLQYAEAIRIFQVRFGRYPTTLSELIEVEPRCIRQLWDDPITGTAEWGLVLADSPQQGTDVAEVRDRRRSRRDRRSDDDRRSSRSAATTRAFGSSGSQSGDTVTQAQIQGVHSLSDETAIRSFFGKETYNEWKFTPNMLNISVGPGGIATPRIRLAMMGKAMPKWLGASEFGEALQNPFGGSGSGGAPNPFGQDATQPFGADFGDANPFGGDDDDAFGDPTGDPFGSNDPFGRATGDAFPGRNQDPFGGDRGSDPFGGDADPFGQDPDPFGNDPFGIPETDNPFGPITEDDGN